MTVHVACPVGETLNLNPFGQVIINLRNAGPVSTVESREGVAFTAEGSPFVRQVMISSWRGSIVMPGIPTTSPWNTKFRPKYITQIAADKKAGPKPQMSVSDYPHEEPAPSCSQTLDPNPGKLEPQAFKPPTPWCLAGNEGIPTAGACKPAQSTKHQVVHPRF